MPADLLQREIQFAFPPIPVPHHASGPAPARDAIRVSLQFELSFSSSSRYNQHSPPIPNLPSSHLQPEKTIRVSLHFAQIPIRCWRTSSSSRHKSRSSALRTYLLHADALAPANGMQFAFLSSSSASSCQHTSSCATRYNPHSLQFEFFMLAHQHLREKQFAFPSNSNSSSSPMPDLQCRLPLGHIS